MIFILNKQEKVVNILRNGGGANQAPPFFDDIYSQDLATGAETFSFSTIAINNIARDLVVGNYVAFKNEDGEYKLFQITQTEEYHEDAMYINVYAEGAGLELINKVFRARKAPSTSLRKFMEMVLDETGWNVGAIPFASQESLDLDLPDATVYATLQSTLSKYGVEMSFRCEINHGRISSKFIDLYSQRGRVTGKRFSFGRDIEGIKRKVDSTELFTALIGRGNKDISFKDVTVDGIDKPLGQDFVADQEAYDRYNNNGYHIVGIFKYDTDSPEELLRETYKQLEKCKEPKIEYEVSVALLGELLGNSWEKVRIGDTIAIVDNAFNPPIHLMARVSKLDKSKTNPQADTCTLANFIEVQSNITDEMRRLASQLEGYVDGALDKKFPIGGEDIQEGAVNGSHIYQNTISTDHLIADAVTADKIKANSIETKHLQADSIKSEHIDTEQIEAEHIKSGTITADKITSDEFITNSAQIKDGIIGTAQIGDAQITVAKIQDLFVDDLVANQGKFQSAHIGVLTSDNIDADTIKADHIMASVIDAINMNVSGKISADRIDADSLKVNEIDAEKITTGTLDADRITSSVITAINASMENATINEARIGNLSANKITAGDISADRMKANAITAINATIGNATINSAKIGELDASKITTGTLDADRIEAGSIDASKINSDTINAIEIGASEITANKIASGEIKVGDANIIDGTISGAKITKASIGNAQISEAFIADAFVKNITADKIKGGTLDAKEITVKNLNADSITVGQINGRQIAGGAISYDKLDSILSGDIRNTIDNVDQALADVGFVQETVKKTVKSVDVEYAINTSSTTAPTTGWQSKPPTWENGKFIWSRTTTVLSDGTSTTTDAVCITGAKGAEGAQGKGVKSIVEQYYLSTSNTTQSGGSWANSPQAWVDGKYMWTRSVITYTDNTTTTTNAVCVTGAKGSTGSSGIGIKSVDVEYYLSASATELSGGSWSTTAPAWVNGKYMWSRTKTVKTDDTVIYSNPACITGAKGDTGATGASGKGIKSTAITYQASNSGTETPTGSWVSTIPTVSAGQYLWTKTVTTYTDNSTVASYSIGKMGSNGAKGDDGKGIKSTSITYQASTSGTTVPSGSWGSSIPTVSAGQFLWTKTVITYTDNTSSTSYSVGKMGEKGATGATGATGQGVESITEEYYLSTSKTTQTGGSWVTTPPAWSTGKYMWTRSKIVYKNPTSTSYTTPICDSSWEAVNNVEEEVTNIVKIVDGKNSIFYSTSAPSTSGKKENDVWFDTDDGYKMYKFTNGAWVATQFGTNAIVSNAITADKIASSSITAGKIASGAVTTDKLYALAVTADKISANAITAGKIATDAVLANNIKAGAITTDKVSAKAINADKLDVDNLFVGDNAFIKKLKAVEIDASNITTGTISNDRIDIRGLISFEALDESLKPVFNVQGDKTYINGGLIATNTIKANSIDLLSGLTVKGEDGQNTFSIASNGEVEVNGLLKSGNFDENKNTGYRLSTDGKAILNQAVVKGDVILPSAGMTNYGGQIGNENMALNTTGIRTITGNNSTNQCTTVAKLEANSISGKTVTISYKYKFAKGAIGTFKVQTAGSHWVQVGEILTADGTEKSGKVVGKLTVTVPTNKEINSLQVRMDNFTGTVEISEIKVEKSEVPTPWCPHPLEQLNHVRIWAGTNYENRENAKFRVYDNGDIYATDGTFSGKMYGDLDSGLVHIHNNEIVINSTSTFMDESGEVRTIEPMDYNPNPYLRLGAGTSILNTDLILGSETDKKIVFSNDNRELNFTNTALNLDSPTRTSGANVFFNPKGSYNSTFGIESVVASTDANLTIGYHNGSWANTTIITHNGSRGGANGDICFKRSNNTEDLNVYVQGNMKVKNSIQSSIQNIEMRSVSNEGWGFYAT